MKKALSIILLLILVIFSLLGCTINERSSDKQGSSATGNYKYSFKNEQEIHTLIMKESGKVDFDVDSKILSGDVNITILNEDGDVEYEGSGKEFVFDKSFNLDIGKYEIKLNYENAVDGIMKLNIFSESFFEYDNGDGEKKAGKEDK